MAKFGRFEFGKTEPAETYEGGYMALERGYVRIFEGEQSAFLLPDMTPPRLLVAIHLENGQSVREIRTEEKNPPKQVPPILKIPTGRKFR